MANEERAEWERRLNGWRLREPGVTLEVCAYQVNDLGVKIGLVGVAGEVDLCLTADQWRAMCALPVVPDAEPAPPPNYAALHAQNSALLKENDKLKRRVAEAEAALAAEPRKARRFELVKSCLGSAFVQPGTPWSRTRLAVEQADAVLAALDEAPVAPATPADLSPLTADEAGAILLATREARDAADRAGKIVQAALLRGGQ